MSEHENNGSLDDKTPCPLDPDFDVVFDDGETPSDLTVRPLTGKTRELAEKRLELIKKYGDHWTLEIADDEGTGGMLNPPRPVTGKLREELQRRRRLYYPDLPDLPPPPEEGPAG
jgi:hypothetical protein